MKMRLAERLMRTSCLAGLVILVACGGAPQAEKHAHGEEAEGGAAEVSDLDRPVNDLMAARCEHEIATYTCDECRYEVGFVKVADDLFNASKGGSFERLTLGDRSIASGKDLNGEVQLNEERAVYLSPKAPGVVSSIGADLGGRVARGQVLFEVESPEFRQAKSAYLRASASLDLAAATEKRESDLYEKKICPQRDLLEAQAARKQAEAEERAAEGQLTGFGLTDEEIRNLAKGGRELSSGLMPVRAPFAGVVLERSLSLGAQVQPGDKLVLLADISKVWVITDLYEREVAAVLEAGESDPVKAEVAVAAYPGRTFSGVLEKVGGTLDKATRTAHGRVVVDNPEGLLRGGMFAKVRLQMHGGQKSLAVPEEAVLNDDGRSFVFVNVTGPYYVRRPVETGRADSGWVEVAGAVKAGDTVVSKGAFMLKSDVLRSKMGAGCAD